MSEQKMSEKEAHLRHQLSLWEAQMDAYDDTGDFRAYARAEMQAREIEAQIAALGVGEGEV